MPQFSSSQTWGFPLMSCALECQPPWRVASCGLGLLGITMWQPLWATCIELHWVRSWTSKKQKRQSPEIQLCNFLKLSIQGFKLKTLYPGVGKSAIRALCTVSIFAEVAVKRSTPLFSEQQVQRRLELHTLLRFADSIWRLIALSENPDFCFALVFNFLGPHRQVQNSMEFDSLAISLAPGSWSHVQLSFPMIEAAAFCVHAE